MPSSRRPVFGLLSADLHHGASTLVWTSVVSEAHRRRLNLISFPGGRLGVPGSDAPLRNRIYDRAGPGCLDGLISWASSLGGHVEAPALEAFHRRWDGLPLVSLSHQLPGAPVVRIDAYSGMCGLVRHLVDDHGLRKVAFVRGPAEHQSAQLRFQAYLDSLRDHGIEPDPRLQAGPLPWDAGHEAVRLLVDEAKLIPGEDFEALVAASDLLALGVFQAFRSRGYRIPQDVVLVGFNGTVESVLSQPHLTTVHLPFEDQGREAVRRLESLWSGSETSGDVSLASRLLIRDSCGCPSRSSRLAAGESGDILAAGEPPVARWLAAVGALGDFAAETLPAWFEPLGAALAADLAGPEGSATMLAVLEKALEHSAAAPAAGRAPEGTVWQDVVSLWRPAFGPTLGPEGRRRLDSLVDRARVRVSAFVEQRSTIQSWEEAQGAETLREVGRRLSAAWTLEALAEALDQVLPWLKIPAGWLVLTEACPPRRPEGPGLARLVWSSSGAGVDRVFPVDQLLPEDGGPAGEPWSLVVEPLYFQDRTVGYAVFQTGPLDGAVYEELRGDLSSALKGIFLMAEAQLARKEAEKADQIKSRLLANVSHELRTPLNQILGHLGPGEVPSPPWGLIRSSAEHQLRLINDLLDLSRAEIDELDLHRRLLDPEPLLRQTFAESAPAAPGPVEWRLDLPAGLPLLEADPVRLKQVLLNLLSNAAKFTGAGRITLGARAEPPVLRLWVADTGGGVAPEVRERLFQPFATGDRQSGIGLGLSISRHLVALHFGSLDLETGAGGSVFHVRLPLPRGDGAEVPAGGPSEPVLALVGPRDDLPAELEAWARREGLRVEVLAPGASPAQDFAPRCLCWDLRTSGPRDRALLRQLRQHPGLSRTPLVVYGGAGLTTLADKADPAQGLRAALEAAAPTGNLQPVYVVDDDEGCRAEVGRLLSEGFPDRVLRSFPDGETAWAALADEVPALIVLDFSMPGPDGGEILDRIRGDRRLRLVPVLLLSQKVFTAEELSRIEGHGLVTFQSKGIWDDRETAEAAVRLVTGGDPTPVHTSAVVKRAVTFLAVHFRRPLARWQIAEEVHVSEDYLSRVFHRELGLSPWDFLNRYRIHQSCRLLRSTPESVRNIALECGFHDQAYFSRVFRKVKGCTPQEFRGRR